VFVLLMHYGSRSLTIVLADMEPLPAVVLSSVLLVLPPLLFLGMVPTLLIRYISTKVDDAGAITGRVYTISSGSGIVALPIMGFVVIPAFGLAIPSIIIGVIIGIVPFFKLLGQKQYISLLFPVFVLLPFSAGTPEQSTADVKIRYYSEGLLGQVLVADVYRKGPGANAVKTNNRILLVNRMGQTIVDKTTGLSQWPYITFAWAVASKLPAQSSVLLLGLGGGGVANVFQNNLRLSVDAVELDQRIAEVAADYFDLNPNVNVIIDDARHYIETTDKKYDLIFFDVFKGEIAPPHVLSLECFRRSKTLLNEGGLIIVNFNGFLSDEIGKPGRSVYMTLQAAGLETKILPTPGREDQRNILFLASAGPEDYRTLRFPLQHLGKPIDLKSLFVDDKKMNLGNAVIFVDDKPILERLNIAASDVWRREYNRTYTRLFSENGITLFR
jgi:spermine/spermidine synthase